MSLVAAATETKINGHRGFSEIAPENTIIALQYAVARAVHGVEFDVRLTADGTVVAVHDDSLARTTNIDSLWSDRRHDPVNTFTATELALLDTGSWKSAWFAGTRIPTLDSIVEALSRKPAHLYVELKSQRVDPEVFAHAVITSMSRRPGAIRPYGAGSMTFMSFDTELLDAISEHSPHARVGLVASTAPTDDQVLRYREFHLDHRVVDEQLISRIHHAGGSVATWTVDDPAEALRCAGAGVDSITTNRVELVQQTLSTRRAKAVA